MKKIICDKEFNKITRKTIRNKIDKAFIALEYNLSLIDKGMDEETLKFIEEKASQMKKEINSFIDSQIERIKASIGCP